MACNVLAELAAVRKRDGDDRLPARRPALELLVAGKLHLAALTQHRCVLHARDIVRSMEGDGPVDQHHGDQMLQADVGNIPIVHDRRFPGPEPHDDLLHLVGRETPPPQ